MPYTEEIQPGSVFKTDVTDTASNDEYLGSCSPWMVEDGDGDRRKQTGHVDMFVHHETRCLSWKWYLEPLHGLRLVC